MLQGHPTDGLVVHQLRGTGVVTLGALSHPILDLGGIVVVGTSFGDGDDQRLDAFVGGTDARRQVPRERGDAAATRWVGPDEPDADVRFHHASAVE
jgi:hypothetical protein